MKKSVTKDFTKGNIPKQLFIFMLPFMLSNALQVLYNTIDMIIVGEYVGIAGLSAVSQSGQIVNFATMVCLGVANAGQVLVSQALGAGKYDKMNRIIGTLFSLLVILSLIFTAIILIFKIPVLNVLNVPVESYEMAMDYLIICGCGLIFTAGYNMVSAVLRGMGDSISPFIFILIASIVNLVLDIIFTGMLGFGVAGAAWATVIGQAFSFLFSIFYLYRNRLVFGFEFKKENYIINKAYAGMIIKLGAPMAVQSGFINLSMLFVNSIVNSVGVVASATFGVGVKIDDIINKISQGIQHAAQPMISQNIGANEKGRAVKVVHYAWIYSITLTIVFMILYIFFGTELFMIFSDDVNVHKMSGEFIKAILWMFPAFALMRGSGAFIQGIGHARLCMILALLDGVFLRIGLSWLFGIVFDMGFYGIVLGYALAPYGYAIPSMLYFRSGKWKKRRSLAEDL